MVENINEFISRQKNAISLLLLLTLMCIFTSFAKYLAIIVIPIYAVVFTKNKKELMKQIEKHFLENHTEEYRLFMESGYKDSLLDIRVSPFVHSTYFVETMFDRVFLEKCKQANKINFITIIMIIILSLTILFTT